MKALADFKNSLDFLLTDIDDTLTDEGLLHKKAYDALWDLKDSGIHVIPVTGRPAGWCELIARQWPVSGVVGENGGFYFRYVDKQMKRHFAISPESQKINRKKLDDIQIEVLKKIPGAAVASDQFCRLMDLAIDFCEDVPPLKKKEVERIVAIFKQYGAQAKVSSIHVNGWFGQYDKLTQSLNMLQNEFNIEQASSKNLVGFSGDSPNDEPMFEFFPNSFAVANIQNFLTDIRHKPAYIAKNQGGLGFYEIAQQILKNK